jgi:hypothetical protein
VQFSAVQWFGETLTYAAQLLAPLMKVGNQLEGKTD